MTAMTSKPDENAASQLLNPNGGRQKSLTVSEIKDHPAYQHLEWKLPAITVGYCTVARNRRGGPFRLYHELHGNGPRRILFIMGFGTPCSAAKRQLRHFGHFKSTEYTCLVLDNRGIGRSDKPLCRYSTSEMAADIVDLLIHVGWLSTDTSLRTERLHAKINVVGSSMGGMIAQEVALLLPAGTINTLTLASTFPRFVRTKGFVETLMEQFNLLFPFGDADAQMDDFCTGLFAKEYLDQQDTEADEPLTGGPEGGNFPTVRDRICAVELRQRADRDGFGLKGLVLQMGAAAGHSLSQMKLQEMVQKVDADRVAICHGTADLAIGFHHAELLKMELGESVEFKVWEGAGHVLLWEKEKEFNVWLDRRISTAEILDE